MCLVVLMSRGRIDVELGWFLWVFRTENHLLVRFDAISLLVLAQVATTNVERLPFTQRIFHPIHDDHTITCGVDDTDFAVVKEVRRTKLWKSLQLQVFRHRHGTTEDEAVVHGVRKVDFVSHHDLLHYKAVTKSLGVIVLHVGRVTRFLEIHIHLGIHTQCAHQQGKTQKCFLHR